MTESPLERLVRLASPTPGPPPPPGRRPVQVRPYQRVERGRVQAVRQHVQAHAAGGAGRQLAGNLKSGNVIQLGLVRYAVTSVKPYARKPSAGPNTKGTVSGRNTGSQGQGVNTSGPASTGSQGAGVNTASADPQAVLDGLARAAKVPFGAPEVEIGLTQVSNGKTFGVLAARSLPVQVVQ